jgi:predicted CopG family antitoxin
MKVTKTITIDVEVAVELSKVKNASDLINSYLKHYFEIPSIMDKTDAQAKAEEAREIAAAFEAKVEELTEKEPERKEVFL